LPPTPPATPPNSGHEWLQVESSESSKSVRFCCDSCSKVFADRAHLAEHRRYRHSDDRPHRCPECAKGFKSRSNLNQHIRTSHERPRFDCQVRLAKRFFPFLERFFFYSKIKFLDPV
jgi:KRAB domain-containing zinc finger protein